MKKKLVAIVCSMTMVAALLAGCGAAKEEAAAPAPAQETQEEAPAQEEESQEESTEEVDQAAVDQAAADEVAALIDAIYVQERTDETDAQCEAAKKGWDALTDEQKELVEGEEAALITLAEIQVMHLRMMH